MNAPRCKPGDLCRVIHNLITDLGGIADRFVTVVAPHENALLETAWSYEGPPLQTVFGQEIQCIPEKWLRPIGNPGADEVDEMVLLKPVPTADEVPA